MKKLYGFYDFEGDLFENLGSPENHDLCLIKSMAAEADETFWVYSKFLKRIIKNELPLYVNKKYKSEKFMRLFKKND